MEVSYFNASSVCLQQVLLETRIWWHIVDEMPSLDKAVEESFKKHLHKVEEKAVQGSELYNAVDTGLYWKLFPTNTCTVENWLLKIVFY